MRLSSSVLFLAAPIACASVSAESAEPPAAPRPQPPPQAPEAPALPDSGWARLTVPGFFLTMELPDRKAWHLARDGSWIVARHAPSNSELRVTELRADRVVNRDGCAEAARMQGLRLPQIADAELVEERFLGAPEGYDTAVRVGVRRSAAGSVGGVAVAVGANLRRCLAMVFLTESSGASAEAAVAERLQLVVSGTLARARAWDIDSRVR